MSLSACNAKLICIDALIAEHMKSCFPSFPVPEDKLPLKKSIFTPQAFRTKNNHFYIGLTPYSVPEFRLLLGGVYVVAGVPLASCPGSTLTEKVSALMALNGSKAFVEKVNAKQD